VKKTSELLDDLQKRTGLDIPLHVDGASGGFAAPFLDPDLEWDFRVSRVQSVNVAGHQYGLVCPGGGWALWRDAEGLPEDLIFWVNCLGDNLPTFALKDDVENFTVFDVSAALRERGWQVPAYTFPKNTEDLAVLRVVVRRGFTMDMADMLLEDLRRKVKTLEKLKAPVYGKDPGGFHH